MTESTYSPTILLPMLHVPLKETESIDFAPGLNDYIRNHYVDDPSKYSSVVSIMNQLRSDVQGVGFDSIGRDILYKYYGQLELLELHFPFGTSEESVKIAFQWTDAFSKQAIQQYAVAFEKASIIFNMGSLMSNLAASSNRSDPDGVKTACNFFECSAGIFKFVSDNFLHAPSTDMSKDFLAILINIMLAQAQECFVDKVISEKKKSSMIFKLANQTSTYYQTALDCMSVSSIKSYCTPLWINTVKLKARYYESMANYHRSLMAETEGQYGEQVSRVQHADSLAKECVKIAKELSGISGIANLMGFVVGADSKKSKDSSPGKTLLEDMKLYQSFISQRNNQFTKDNDVIYHASVPAVSSLPVLDKMSLVNPKKLTDLFPNLPEIVGSDMFKTLIPLDVCEKSSIYSEEKSKLVRSLTEKVENANSEMTAMLASLNLPESITRIKEYKKVSSGMMSSSMPSEIFSYADYIKNNESKEPLPRNLQRLGEKREQIENILIEVDKIIVQDGYEWENMRNQYPNFMQLGPETASESIKNDLTIQKNNLNLGKAGDDQLNEKLKSIDKELKILKSSENDLEVFFKNDGGLQEKNALSSLLDLPVNEEENDIKVLKTVDDILQELNILKKERLSILAELKKKVQEEDINQILILNKSNEESVFKVELEKFNVYNNKIGQNLANHTSLVSTLSKTNSQLLQTKLARNAHTNLQEKSKLTKRLFDAKCSYEEIRSNSLQGLRYYDDVFKMISNLRERAVKFLQSRQNERNDFIKKVVESPADILQRKISALNMNNQQPVNPYAQPPSTSFSGNQAAAPPGGYYMVPPPNLQPHQSPYGQPGYPSAPPGSYQ